MYLKLKSIREECGGCPTHYTGKTVDGIDIEMYLRHGNLSIKVNGRQIINEYSKLDGVCNVEDFKSYAIKKGIIIDTRETEWSSHIQEMTDNIEALFANRVWVTFIQDFHSKSANKTYEKGKEYTANLEVAKALIDAGLVVVESKRDLEKLKKII